MPCGECKWWLDRETTGWCQWANGTLPPWLALKIGWGTRDNEMRRQDGHNCPQFAPRAQEEK